MESVKTEYPAGQLLTDWLKEMHRRAYRDHSDGLPHPYCGIPATSLIDLTFQPNEKAG